jgi:hypothetical protein
LFLVVLKEKFAVGNVPLPFTSINEITSLNELHVTLIRAYKTTDKPEHLATVILKAKPNNYDGPK